MRKTIIDGREAVPVRLIPFIAGWGDFTPDSVARILSSGKDGYGFGVELTAYHLLSDGTYKAMFPKEWDAVFIHQEVLTKKLKNEDKKERVKNLNREVWERQSIEKLPSFAFVWLDDLKAAYDDVMEHTQFARWDGELGEAVPTERPGDKDLNFSPRLPPGQVEIVFEGFPQRDFDPIWQAEYEAAWNEQGWNGCDIKWGLWMRRPLLTAKEAGCLLCTIDPYAWDNRNNPPPGKKEGYLPWEKEEEVKHVIGLAESEFDAGMIGKNYSPWLWVCWAKKKEIPVPLQFNNLAFEAEKKRIVGIRRSHLR